MQVYTYKKTYFNIEVLFTGIFCALLLGACVVQLVLGIGLPALILWLVAIVSFYQVWNTFIAIANPESVEFGDNEIAFLAFGRKDAYKLSEIKDFKVRDMPGSGKMYVRVNGGGILKGRYWLSTQKMSDGDELYQRLLDFEYEKDPDSLKARARRSNELYSQHKDEIEAHKRAARKGSKKKK